MIALPLGVLAALAASGESTRLQLDATLAIDGGTMSATPPPLSPPPGHWIGATLDARASLFHRRISDDDAPPPLQPFLQRVWTFSVDAGGSATDSTYPALVLNPQVPSIFESQLRMSDRGGHGTLSADGWIGRYVSVAARLGLRYDRWQPDPSGQAIGGFGNVTPIGDGVQPQLDSSELALDAAASVGVRWRDLHVSAGWGVVAYRIGSDALHVNFWGGAFVDARAVIRRRVDVQAHVALLDGGAAASGDVTVWLRRRFGLTLGAEGAHGAFADSPARYDRAGGHVGVAWWLVSRIAVSLRYAPAWQSPTPLIGLGGVVTNYSRVEHVVTLTMTARPRTAR